MNRQRLLKRFPPPPPTPDGMVWRTDNGVTRLIPAEAVTQDSRIKMGNFDKYPPDVREIIRETGRKP